MAGWVCTEVPFPPSPPFLNPVIIMILPRGNNSKDFCFRNCNYKHFNHHLYNNYHHHYHNHNFEW